MRIPEIRLPDAKEGVRYLADLVATLKSTLTGIRVQLNNLSEGRIAGATNAQTAAPTTGDHQVGDFVRNSAPAEVGTAGSKYVIEGWLCTVAGTPGTWVQKRCLTGN